MRVCIGIPPISDPRGHFQIQQNRQSQIFAHGAYIYPVISASAATMLKEAGHEVLWADGEAEEMSWTKYLDCIRDFGADIVVWDSKTPSIKRIWDRVNTISGLSKVILVGDHVTALPEATIEKSETYAVITGGDFDFGILEFIKQGFPKGIFRQDTTSSLRNFPVPDRELS